jgi:ketose-bisphosphate aldolase
MLARARRDKYAVCYCESWNLESLEAVVEAAEESEAPVIAGFNGAFLRHQSRRKPERLAFYSGFRTALERARVPVVFLLNESDSLPQMLEGIENGFNAVMPENEGLDQEAHRTLVKQVVSAAHARGVSVEAQIGALPLHSANSGHSEITDPDFARDFVEATRIDALAVSVGNVHIMTNGQAKIDMEALRRIREKTGLPLVIHGGTSVPLECIEELIELGVAKINYGTVLKQAYLEAVRAQIACYHAPEDPHPFLGIGGERDIMTAGREALKNKIKQLLRFSKSAGTARKTAKATI